MQEYQSFPHELTQRVWHTTTLERFKKIVHDEAILPEPNIPDEERWSTSKGADYYPFVRSLGGISLFDFVGFNEKSFDENVGESTWKNFVPNSGLVAYPVWLEIDTSKLKDNYLDASITTAKWNSISAGQVRRKFIPYIEAAHIGPITLDKVMKVLIFDGPTGAFVDKTNDYLKDKNTTTLYGR